MPHAVKRKLWSLKTLIIHQKLYLTSILGYTELDIYFRVQLHIDTIDSVNKFRLLNSIFENM